MQAILLADGSVDKLKPLTGRVASPMLPIANRPAMAHVVEQLVRHDIQDIVVSLHHQAGQIEGYFQSGRRFGAQLTYVLQREQMGTGGVVRRARSHLHETTIVLPADAYFDLDISAVIAQHRERGSQLTVIMHDATNHDVVEPLHAQNGSAGLPIVSALPDFSWQATNAFILEPEVVDLIPAEGCVDILEDVVPLLELNGLPVDWYQMDGFFNTLGSFEAFQAAQRLALDTRPSASSVRSAAVSAETTRAIWLERDVVVHPEAQLIPPVYIGNQSRIGRQAVVGPDVVIGSAVVVDDEATVSHSTILPQTYVGRLVDVRNRVVHTNLIVDVASEESVEVSDNFLLGSTQQVVRQSLRRVVEAAIGLVCGLLTLPLLFALALLTWLIERRTFEKVTLASAEFEALTVAQLAVGDGSWGHFLTRWQLHRLPQLWQVVVGKLALVGTTPRTLAAWQQMAGEWYAESLTQEPGLTGLWFVQQPFAISAEEAAITDAYYLATQNWRQDALILLRTPLAWLRRGVGNISQLN